MARAKTLDTTPVVKRNDEDDEDAPVKKPIQPTAVNLSHVAAKYSPKSLGEFLFQPLQVRSSGRMPDMKLTPAEAQAIASYLLGDQPKTESAIEPQPDLVSLGQKYFQELNCAACHTVGNNKPAPLVGPLSNADFTRGCLSIKTSNSPQFHLAEAQIQAIKTAAQTPPTADSAPTVLAKTLTAFNCISCHLRDDYGGVHENYNAYFQSSEKNLGDDARIPPPLTMVGAKLQPSWMKKVLFDGESVRPYMATRMPQFGAANLHHLPEILARLDVMPGPGLPIPDSESKSAQDREQAKLLRAAGRELLGDKALNCVNCHNFNGKPSPTNRGIDLMTSYERLQPAWFRSFLLNPSSLRPRIVMPTAWPDGVATHKKILDGNTDQQLAAIWFYMSLGTSAADPSGIRVENTKLAVGDKAEVHRGRSRVAGFRGIAVGLPEKLSYAFNAETGTLSAIWQGDFVGVNWQGQGSGDFNPLGDAITLAQDVSFAALADEKAAWPLLPVMTKEAPINPDPLYPKNVGYQFRGYALDEFGVPTFMYRSGVIEIKDRAAATGSPEQRQLKRVLNLASPEPQTIWFRALTGDVQQESARSYRSGKLRLTILRPKRKYARVPLIPRNRNCFSDCNSPKAKPPWNSCMNPFPSNCLRRLCLVFLLVVMSFVSARAEEVGERWGTEEREREYYPIRQYPASQGYDDRSRAFAVLPNRRVAVGTRHGEIYLLSGVDDPKPTPKFHRFATGLDEIFGLVWHDNALRVTQSCELTRVSDSNNDGVADRFETISDAWGYANYHEYAFGSKLDADGNQFIALGLSASYYSNAWNRGFIMKVSPIGKTTAFASGLRSPGGIGHDEHGQLFYIESQGPWNCSCSLKAVTPQSFHGHPASFVWYKQSPELGPVPETPRSGNRIATEKEHVKQLVPYAVIFPYIRMGRSITAFNVDKTGGKFGPFENQIFLGDYTQSIIMRATTEQVNGVWQGACYPFREGLSTVSSMSNSHPRKSHLRRYESRLARAWHQAVCAGTARLER